MLNLDTNTFEANKTLEIPRDELESIVIDLQSLSDLISVLEDSDHYNDMVCRSLKIILNTLRINL